MRARNVAFGTGVCVIAAAIAWTGIATRHGAPADDRVRIVAGSTGGVREQSKAPARVSSGAVSIPDMTDLTVNERAAAIDARPRDPAWAEATERQLRRQLDGAVDGLVVDAARCTDVLCAVEATIPARQVPDRQRLVDELVRGTLHPAFGRAGLLPNGSITIDADDAGALHITQYLRRR